MKIFSQFKIRFNVDRRTTLGGEPPSSKTVVLLYCNQLQRELALVSESLTHLKKFDTNFGGLYQETQSS